MREASMPPPQSKVWWDARVAVTMANALRFLVLVASAAFVVMYVAIAVRRLAFPFDLEWMEGGSVDHVRRLLAGEKIYVPPSLSFIPYVYPPLYYYVSAAVALVTGLGVFPLRLVSFVSSLGCFGALHLLVWRETGRREAGVIAAGIFAATYRTGGAWLDLARVDSLFLLLTLAAVYLLRHGRSAWSWAIAGVLMALSALTKQTALMIALPLLLYAAIVDRRRALILAASAGIVFGATTLLLDLVHHGWYWYYVFGLPARIQDVGREAPAFWRRDLLGAMPIASAAGAGYLLSRAAQRHRPALFYAALAVAMIGSSWASRAHSGAYANVLIPAYACLSVLLALAVYEVPELAAPDRQPYVRIFLFALCGLQLATLTYSVQAQVPTRRDLDLQQRLIRLLAETDGEVYLPQHGYFPLLAGKEPHAQSWALTDILRAGGEDERRRLTDEIHQALQEHRFRLIVLNRPDPWLEKDLKQYYRRAGRVFDRDGLWTRTGYRTRPAWIYVPRSPE